MILRGHRYYPYHVSLHQHFELGGYIKPIEFCNWILNTTEETPNFVDNVILTGEAHFSRTSVVNLHNAHYWMQLGLTQKRNELKLDAVPTVFHEQSEPATSTLQAVRQGQAQVKDQVLLIKSHPSMKQHQTMIFQNSAFFIQVQEVKRMTS
ncbi:uncharacterized protein LOC135379157 [Ornithodoros turicata]|uniref:uncharacterized protein LOC135379157 n=1 Tax=Ornithodoros turicata TaxID=34597 RepID=UPI00313A301F